MWLAKISIVAAIALVAMPAFATLDADPIYQSHMVLQQGRPVPISGTTSGSGAVVVKFAGQEVKAKVKGKKWQAVLEPMKVQADGQPLTITQGKESVTLDDVVVGEVWLASGQSNMLFRLDETGDTASMKGAAIPHFRFYHAEPQVHTSPKAYTEDLCKLLMENRMYKGEWHVSEPGACNRMSAVGWYFGKNLQRCLSESAPVPVGIIHVSLGGSEMMAWMPPALLNKKYKDCLSSRWLESKYVSEWVRMRGRQNIGKNHNLPHPYKPGYLFESGISPWVKFPIAGVIWYQGESDAEIQDQAQNRQLLTDLITSWRTAFKSPELPFIMVQLPRINDTGVKSIRLFWPEFRQVQQQVADEMPKVSCVTTLDLGSTDSNVHPKRKVEVGERLAAVAAAQVYDKQDVAFSGPVVAEVKPQEGKLCVSFSHAKGLKTKDGKAPVGFEVSANGKNYYPAEAEIRGESVLLSSPKVGNPKYVRYGWAVYIEPNLVNEAGLPTVPYSQK